MAIREGDLFDGKYRIEHLLGRGGMGEVWSAVGVEDSRKVAIKVLLEKSARKADIVARFEREARIAARVKSPYVCEMLSSGRSPTGELYLVFELLRGESMGDRLRREGDMAFSDLAPTIDNVIEGIITAHSVGVVHRDLKPANIFLVEDPTGSYAKILDFGISKILSRSRASDERSLTSFDATLGSFAYMAPEQVRGAARADERADIYAVGAVIFRALSGRLPFEGTTAAMLVSAKLNGEPPTLADATGEQWPASIERFLAKALARNRDDRFASAAEMLQVWREVSRSHTRILEAGSQAVSGFEQAPPVESHPPPAPMPSQPPYADNGPSVTEVMPPPGVLADLVRRR